MNSVILIIVALPIFILGYRFYAKFLSLGTFRLHETETATRAGDTGGPGPWLLLGHHLAAIAGGTTVLGVATATAWGWVPALLWIVSGIVIGGGTFAMASLWIGRRQDDNSPVKSIGELIGPRACGVGYALAFIVLLILAAALALIIGRTLMAYPQAALAFWLQVPLALALGRWSTGPSRSTVGVLATAVLLFGPLVWLGQTVPITFSGTLQLEFGGFAPLLVDGTVVWLALVFVYGFFAVRLPLERLSQPRAVITALALGAALLILFGGLAVEHPVLAAPAFNKVTPLPATIPWLFVVLTGGAIAGFQGLFAATVTAPRMTRDSDVRMVGYGAALGDGLLAVGVLAVCAAAFADAGQWHKAYDSWDRANDIDSLLTIFIGGFGRLAGALGLTRPYAEGLGALLVASLALSTFETALRVLQRLLSEVGERIAPMAAMRPRTLVWVSVALPAAVALYDGYGRGGAGLWPLLGGANQILAAILLLPVAVTLVRQRQPAVAVLVPAMFLAAVTLWALALQVLDAWAEGRWDSVVGTLTVSIFLIWALVEGGFAYRRETAAAAPKPPFK
jgi:carbon starvation protein